MITGELRSQVDRLWDAFWACGIANPREVIEQIIYLLFIKRLDDLHTAREKKATRLKRPIENPIFSEAQQTFHWSRFKNEAPAEMFRIVFEEVFPFIRRLQEGRKDSTYSHYMKDVQFTIPTPGSLPKVVDMGFGKEVCEISRRHGVVQELKETLAYPHFDFGNSFCTAFHNFTALFAFLIVIRVAVQKVHFWHCLSPKALNYLQ